MLAATESGVRIISLMACTQLLKTTVMECIQGRFIHLDPGPMLAVYPKDDAAETYSKDRLAPMIRDTPVLRKIFGKGDERKAGTSHDASNTLSHKQFPGGHISMVGANSPTNLAMRPIRFLFADEIDKYPLSAGTEGDPITLAEERQAEFSANRLSVRACSPTIEGRSAIAASYDESDQRKAFVACPHCGGMQDLVWERVRWDTDDRDRIRPETARYVCASCEKPWSEADRLVALQRIEWRQTREFDCCGKHQKPEQWKIVHGVGRALCSECGRMAVSNEHAGFYAWKIHAPKQEMRDLVKKFRRALAKGPEALKTFFNTQIARTWKETGEAPEWTAVYERRDKYKMGTCPAGVLMLFAGVDVQKDRLEVRVWGFGRDRQRWLVDVRILPGSPTTSGVWTELAKLFGMTWPHELGGEMQVRDWGIDSAAFSSEVAAFVRSQRGRGNVHATRGHDKYEGAFLGVGAMEVSADGKKLSRGLKTLKIGVSFCKQELVGQLSLAKPIGEAPYPPGFVHLPEDVTDDEVKQLTSEQLVTRVVRGRTRREWGIIEGRRNEGLDCANIARGLASMRGWDRWRESRFSELEALIKNSAGDGDDDPPPGSAPPSEGAQRATWMGRQRGWLRPKQD
jgi:phage terminase large subunit GpA-like protein